MSAVYRHCRQHLPKRSQAGILAGREATIGAGDDGSMTAGNRALAKARFLGGEPMLSIAASLGVKKRTIERWSSADSPTWGELRDQAKAAAPVLAVVPTVSKRPSPPPRVEPVLRSTPIRPGGVADELSVIDDAITHLSADLTIGNLPGKGQLATAIVRLYERRETLEPQTLDQLLGLIARYLERNQMGLADLAVALRDRLARPAASRAEVPGSEP
jgi:hypothetical protein